MFDCRKEAVKRHVNTRCLIAVEERARFGSVQHQSDASRSILCGGLDDERYVEGAKCTKDDVCTSACGRGTQKRACLSEAIIIGEYVKDGWTLSRETEEDPRAVALEIGFRDPSHGMVAC